MKRNKIARGTPPPLFDRIVNDKTSEGGPPQLLNAKELEESIIHELSTVLNTRCTVRKVIYEDHIETIPLFGFPDFFGLGDFSYFEGNQSQEWPKVALFIETAIQAAEPRLKNVSVQVDNYDAVNNTLSVNVAASLKEQTLLKELHFPLTLQNWMTSAGKAAA
jgi:type VI secretion system lysozyme-like protein